jgi:glycosyltransferase involved in cell wall biosynthesis
MGKISVIIITRNEEENIEPALKSVEWADEIIVVDSGSEDKTIDITKKYTNKIYKKEWQGFVEQKKYALGLASYEWVLSIDADERVSPELKEEIMKKQPENFDGFNVRRRNYFFNREITTCGWDKDYQLRLFKKSKVDLKERLVHEGFEVYGKVGKLENVIIHNTFSSLHNYFRKVNDYTTLQAEEMYKAKKKVTALMIWGHTFSAFFRYYISLKGFRDGMHGLIISFINSVSTLLTYTKIWERQR